MGLFQLNTNDVLQALGSSYSSIINNLLQNIGLSGVLLHLVKMTLISISLLTICFIADFIGRKFILVLIEKVIKRTKNTWDDVLVEKKVFKNVAHILPAVMVSSLASVFYKGHTGWVSAVEKIADIYLAIAII